MSCQGQFAAGMLVIVTSVSHRRYLVVDEDEQIVSAIVTLDHRGNLESVPMARGRTVTPNRPFARPFSFLIFESCKVVDGRMRQIEATAHTVPYRMHPGWPRGDSADGWLRAQRKQRSGLERNAHSRATTRSDTRTTSSKRSADQSLRRASTMAS
jgi:hypothetical protein